MELSDQIPSQAERHPETTQAPSTLLAGLNQRLKEYQQTRSSTSLDLETALQDPRWEIRCAALEHIDLRSSLPLLEQALNDEDEAVRQVAVRLAGRLGDDAPLALLQSKLQDEAWQVREMVLLTAGEYRLALPASALQAALNDGSEVVRQAAHYASERLMVQQAGTTPSHTNKSLFRRNELAMSTHTQFTQNASPNVKPRRRLLSPLKIGILAATLVLVLGVLSAAGFALGWWSPQLGNPDQYTRIAQEKTIDGITVRLLKVYLDQGRTVIVFDILSPSTDKIALPGTSTMTSSYPQKQGEGRGGYNQPDKQEPRLRHHFIVDSPFEVPANVQKLNITWTLAVDKVNAVTSDTDKKVPPETVSFTFTFTAPIHHVDNKKITYPFPATTNEPLPPSKKD
ncbi:MAG TPA: HEAT repeat domain-containing protein [Ktedonobacteraceae bacterium]|nr:HEAT repeat domain-containing protein [Ktedonobacteraceae bacterium]